MAARRRHPSWGARKCMPMAGNVLGLLMILPLLAGSVRPTEAPGQAAVSGHVTNEQGVALANVSVLMRDQLSGQVRYSDATDSLGHFRWALVAKGRYSLEVRHVGYAAVTYPVFVELEAVRLAISLVQQPVRHDEVIVTGRRARTQVTPVTFSNITAEQLQARPDMKDLPALLVAVPSVTYHTENGNSVGYSTLRMRGFDQRRIAVSINGIPQNDPEDFNVFWVNFFDIQGSVQDVQVQRGAGSAQYGSTGIGGAIDILARPYKSYRYAEAEVGFGAFGTRRFSLEANSGLLANRYVVFGRLSRLESDGYRDWSWTEFWRFFGGISRYGERSTLTLQVYGGPQRDGLAFSGIPRSANGQSSLSQDSGGLDRRFNASEATRDVEDFHQPHAELHHELQLGSRLRLRQSFFWVQGVGFFDFGATFRSANYLMLPAGFVADELRAAPLFVSRPDVSLKFRAYLDQWQVGWIPRLTILSGLGETTVGAEARLHRSLRWGRIQEASGIPEDLVGGEADRRVYQFRGEKTISSISASHLIHVPGKIAVQADALLTYRRYRVYDEDFFGTAFSTPYIFLNPRIGVTLRPERAVSFYASLAIATREPRLKSLYDGEEAGAGFTPRFRRDQEGNFDFGEPLVKPERVVDIELGSTWRTGALVLSVNGYWMEFFDEIVPSGGLDQFGVPRSGNAEKTRHLGVETEASIGLARSLTVKANASIGRARYRTFNEFVTLPDFTVVEADRSGNRIPGFPTATGSAALTYDSRGWSTSAFIKVVSRQNIDNTNARGFDGVYDENLTVDPFVLTDLSLSYTFDESSRLGGLTLGVDVNNVFNDKVLLFGNVGPVGPQFFPTATRHAFFRARYVLR